LILSCTAYLHKHYVLSIIILLYATYAVICPPASYQELHTASVQEANTVVNLLTPTCVPCPKGYYQDRQAHVKCKKCTDGYTTWNISSRSPKDCHKQCYLGYYSLDGFQPCLKCPNGTYSALPGSTECLNCTELALC